MYIGPDCGRMQAGLETLYKWGWEWASNASLEVSMALSIVTDGWREYLGLELVHAGAVWMCAVWPNVPVLVNLGCANHVFLKLSTAFAVVKGGRREHLNLLIVLFQVGQGKTVSGQGTGRSSRQPQAQAYVHPNPNEVSIKNVSLHYYVCAEPPPPHTHTHSVG